jgi:uncharacterized zinc-type alcohol dehydrogenase-like protein
MVTFTGMAAMQQDGRLESFSYDLAAPTGTEVDIAVQHCGVCHSDLSMIDNEWGASAYPLVAGHEVIGRVDAVGPDVAGLAVGDLVGLGWHAGYCMRCDQCMGGHHNTCPEGQPTIIGRHGGFADKVRAREAAVIKLPEGIDPKTAGPLLCGGVTVFTPIRNHASPTGRVGVIGIGGLGHLALQFARAWGAHVTAFTSSEGKVAEALEMGAHDTLNSRDPAALAGAAGQFDLILSTVNAKLDWNAYIGCLKPRGRLHLVGAVLEPLDIATFGLLAGEKEVGASPSGTPVDLRDMFRFAARHGIAPVTEHYPMSDVNAALDHLRAGKARYRVVLDR